MFCYKLSKIYFQTVCVFIELLFFYSGSLAACDSFVNTFEGKGLRKEVVCPCAHSSAGLTVAIRR